MKPKRIQPFPSFQVATLTVAFSTIYFPTASYWLLIENSHEAQAGWLGQMEHIYNLEM